MIGRICIGFVSGIAVLAMSTMSHPFHATDQPTIPDVPGAASATRVVGGELSEEQRFHSKYFENYKSLNGDHTLVEMLSLAEIEHLRLLIPKPNIEFSGQSDSTDAKAVYREMGSNSNLVMRGTVIGKASQITADGGFIFTDYQVQVKSVLKAPVEFDVTRGDMVTVVRPGGAVLLDGHFLEAIDQSAENLALNLDYVFFLRFIPETGGFIESDNRGAFAIGSDSRVRSISGEFFRPDLQGQTVDQFLENIAEALEN